MKTKIRRSLMLASLIALAAPGVSHADPYHWGYRLVPVHPADAPFYCPSPAPAHPGYTGGRGGDYQPHLARAYRMGYLAGRQDRAWGLDRNYRRAFEFSGSGWESYFQEGYADGYERRPMSH